MYIFYGNMLEIKIKLKNKIIIKFIYKENDI
jgi:hypothetical protein